MKRIILMMVLLFSTSTAFAQLSDDEASNLEYILASYENLQSLSSYQVTGTVTGTQYLVADGSGLASGTLDLFLDLSYTSLVVPTSANEADVSVNMEQSFRLIQDGGAAQSLAGSLDLIAIGSEKFGKFILETPQPGIPQDEWFDWDEMLGANNPNFPIQNTWSEPFFFRYLMTEASVTSVVTMPDEEVDGQLLHVFWVSVDAQALRDGGVITLTSIGEGSDLNMTATLTGMGDVVSDVGYLAQIRISAETDLPYDVTYLYTNDISASGANADQDIIGKLFYSDYDGGGTVEAPTLGS